LHDEEIDPSQPLEIFDPEAIWKRKILTDFTMVELQKPIFLNGELVYELPSIAEIRDYCQEQLATLWDEIKRMENPQHYYVDLSQKLWDLKQDLLLKNR
jgi:nicotinate phosphoribosyltransferase